MNNRNKWDAIWLGHYFLVAGLLTADIEIQRILITCLITLPLSWLMLTNKDQRS